jgi:hypothetical protein
MSEPRAAITTTATRLRRELFDVIDSIGSGGAPRVVTLRGEPRACIVRLPGGSLFRSVTDFLLTIGGALAAEIQEAAETAGQSREAFVGGAIRARLKRQPVIKPTENCDRINFKHLDPGIRDVVTALWDAGLETSDSGDGVSKPAVGRDYKFEHVVIVPSDDDEPWCPHFEMEQAIKVVTDVRPGEFWSALFTQELRTTDDKLRECIFLRRHDGEP